MGRNAACRTARHLHPAQQLHTQATPCLSHPHEWLSWGRADCTELRSLAQPSAPNPGRARQLTLRSRDFALESVRPGYRYSCTIPAPACCSFCCGAAVAAGRCTQAGRAGASFYCETAVAVDHRGGLALHQGSRCCPAETAAGLLKARCRAMMHQHQSHYAPASYRGCLNRPDCQPPCASSDLPVQAPLPPCAQFTPTPRHRNVELDRDKDRRGNMSARRRSSG